LIYNILTHIEHRLTDIPEDKAEERLRTKYTDPKNKGKSKFYKEYEHPAFFLPARQRKALSEDELALKEQEHAQKCVYEEKLLEEGRTLIDGIENREEWRSTSDEKDLDKIAREMEEKGDARKMERQEKLNQ
jgi:hypothetical protein